jgi:Spy/CpxP family protein refolding chaperone
MKNKVILAVIISSLALNLAVVGTFAYNRFFNGQPQLSQHDPENFMPFKDMNLNKQQRDTMFQLIREFRIATKDERQKINSLENALFDIIPSNEKDSTEIIYLIEQIAERRMQQSIKAINYFKKFKEVLTTEQQEHFLKMIMDRRPDRRRIGRGRTERPLIRSLPNAQDTIKN